MVGDGIISGMKAVIAEMVIISKHQITVFFAEYSHARHQHAEIRQAIAAVHFPEIGLYCEKMR